MLENSSNDLPGRRRQGKFERHTIPGKRLRCTWIHAVFMDLRIGVFEGASDEQHPCTLLPRPLPRTMLAHRLHQPRRQSFIPTHDPEEGAKHGHEAEKQQAEMVRDPMAFWTPAACCIHPSSGFAHQLLDPGRGGKKAVWPPQSVPPSLVISRKLKRNIVMLIKTCQVSRDWAKHPTTCDEISHGCFSALLSYR
jgi:hypothetical protein